ncbi:MAG: type II toxin-antitoxin system VapC family toxin [Acidiferrobacter sp.]
MECDSAVAIKRRRGEMDADGQAAAIADINAFVAYFAPFMVPVAEDYQRARALCRHAASGLRTGDALHLAMALRWDVTHFATLDKILAANAIAHGLATLVMPPSTGA